MYLINRIFYGLVEWHIVAHKSLHFFILNRPDIVGSSIKEHPPSVDSLSIYITAACVVYCTTIGFSGINILPKVLREYCKLRKKY